MSEIAERITEVHERIADACRRAGRDRDDVELLAVSKRQPMDRLMAAYHAGQRNFGENYVQALCERADAMPKDARWHMIGHLQTNKAKKLIGRVVLVHTVHSQKLAKVLGRLSPEPMAILIQVNVGREPQKSGVLPEDLPRLLEQLAEEETVQIKGFMTIPPEDDAPRRWYAALRELRDGVQPKCDFGLRVLSMGMSGDYESAILEGATLIRLGTQVFGPRTD